MQLYSTDLPSSYYYAAIKDPNNLPDNHASVGIFVHGFDIDGGTTLVCNPPEQ